MCNITHCNVVCHAYVPIVQYLDTRIFTNWFACTILTINCPQFCQWWELINDMEPIIGKYWMPGSASAAMARAILCHPDSKEEVHMDALHRASTFYLQST